MMKVRFNLKYRKNSEKNVQRSQYFGLQERAKKTPFIFTFLCILYHWILYSIEQKGIVFLTPTLVIHSPFLLRSFIIGGKRKEEKNNQSRGKKTMPFCSILCLSFSALFQNFEHNSAIIIHILKPI